MHGRRLWFFDKHLGMDGYLVYWTGVLSRAFNVRHFTTNSQNRAQIRSIDAHIDHAS